MNVNARTVIAVFATVVLVGVGYVAYSFFKTPESASGPIEAEPIAVDTDANGSMDRDASDAATDLPGPAASEDEPDEIEPDEIEADDVEAAGAAGATEMLVFEIVPAESEARFLIDEVLRGSPITVVGSTDQVSGQIAVDPADPSSAQVGTILVNVRDLTTDSSFRDRAIKNRILMTDAHEFVTFTPTDVNGDLAGLAVGDRTELQVGGELAIAGTTRPATFDVTVSVLSDDRIEGLATTTLRYAEHGLTIPASRSVDAVADEVVLELAFVAVADS